MRRIVLASASPRRKELLEQIGLAFEVDPSNHDEEQHPGLSPTELAVSLSIAKAETVAPRHPHAIIIAADTFIVLDDQILGKAHTADEARAMLRTLSGRMHWVITGLTVMDTYTGQTFSESVRTRVHMRRADPREIERYIDSGEPLGKAGAYAIQGLGAVLIEGIEGDYSNVVGLPLAALARTLREFGISLI